MGVKGLLPTLQSITKSVSLERYRGLTVAVDAMSWLHKGVFACDVKALAKSQRGCNGSSGDKPTQKIINYTISKAETLKVQFGIDVILVIDGDALPSKKEENIQRREERDKAFDKAVAAEKARDSRAARRFYAQSCSVTHRIRYMLITACKQLGINFIVAPYEADPQMARMAHNGAVDLVITEDSDLLVYGVPRALFKVDWDTHQGQEIQLMRDLGENVTPSFRNWTHDMFTFMCIISGCDYCSGVPGIGIKLAHKLVRIHRTPSRIFSALRAAGRMPTEFEEQFWVAYRTFRHQRVFCPSKQQIETLWPIAGSNHNASPNEVWPFLGEYVESTLAIQIANGELHPTRKISWSEALKQDEPMIQSKRNDSVQIHRRSSSSSSDQNPRRGTNREKTSNVWHSLVYGSKNGDDSRRQHPSAADAGKENHLHSTHQQHDSAPTKRDMFSFFPQNKKRGEEDAAANGARNKPTASNANDSATTRPPLQEIYVGNDSTSSSSSRPKSKSNYVPPAHHRDIPIHFNEYASRLVGRAFKPISRKRKKQEIDGSKSSRFVQKIWERAKVQRPVLQIEGQAPEEEHEEVENEESAGVSRFKKDSGRSVGCEYVYDHEENQADRFQAPSHDTTYQYPYDSYEEVATQQQRNALTNFSSHQHDPGQFRYDQSETYYDDGLGRQNNWQQTSRDTTCEEVSHAQYASTYHSSHQPILEPYYLHDDLPQSQLDVAFKDPGNDDEHNLFAELQSFHDPAATDYNFQTGHAEYQQYDHAAYQYDDIEHKTEDFNGPNPFEQLRTTMKKKSSSSTYRSDYYTEDQADPVGHSEFALHHDNTNFNDGFDDSNPCSYDCYHDQYDATEETGGSNPFEQLKTVMKRRSY